MSVRVVSWVWEHSTRGGIDRLVLLAIADTADDTGTNVSDSIAALARKVGVDQRTVQRAVRRLKASGELRVVESAGGQASNQYVVVMPTRRPTSPQGAPAGVGTARARRNTGGAYA